MRSSDYTLLKLLAGIALLIPALHCFSDVRHSEHPPQHLNATLILKQLELLQHAKPRVLTKAVLKLWEMPERASVTFDSAEPVQKKKLRFGKTESELSYTFYSVLISADADKDSQLSKEELTAAYYSPETPETLYSDILSMLLGFDHLTNPETRLINSESYINQSQGRIAALPHSLIDPVWNSDGSQDSVMLTLFPFGLSSIRPKVIFQRNLGDCQIIAALASLARSEVGKRRILNYFKHLGDQQLEVKLPGASKPILVDLDSTRADDYAFTEDGGKWLSYLEKALALYAQEYPVSKVPGELTSAERILSEWKHREYRHLIAADAMTIIPLLTGKRAHRISFTHSDITSELNNILSNDFPGMEVITAGTGKDAVYSHLSLLGEHAFSIVAYDAEKQRITLRDPNGIGDPVNLQTGEPLDGVADGYFELTLEEFQGLFEVVIFSEPEWYDKQFWNLPAKLKKLPIAKKYPL